MVPGSRSALIEMIEATDPGASSAGVGELLAARERLDAKVCAALAGFLGRGLHQIDGWSSPVGWLKAHGLSEPDAKRLAVRAQRLAVWPTLARSWFDSELAGAQVDIVVRLIPKGLVDLYTDHDTEVSPHLVGLSLPDTTRAMREWVARAEAVSADPAVDEPGEHSGSRVHLSRTLGGRAIVDADLDADTATLAETALRIAERPDEPGEFRTASERRGDALGAVVRFFCDHHARAGARPGHQHPHVAVTIDPDDLIAGSLRGLGITSAADLERFLAARPVGIFEEGLYRDALAHAAGAPVDHDGYPLTARSLVRLFTEGTLLHRLLMAEGQVIDRGRSLRLASPNLRDAMVARDRGCRFPHCDAPTEWVHAHHLQHWEAGGPTDLPNLAGLCATHHGVVHRHGWSLTRHDDGTLEFRRPDGHTLASPPPRRHRPPPLPLHHPRLRGLVPELPDASRSAPGTLPGSASADLVLSPDMTVHSQPTRHDERGGSRERGVAGEPSDHHTACMVRARVVDLVHRHHRRAPSNLRPLADLCIWPEAG